jgi:autotransporter translocation and assembly factor TamB
VLAAIALVLGLVLLVQRLLDASYSRQTAIRWFVTVADTFGVDLQVGSLEWGYLPPTLRLGDVTIAAGQVQAEVDRLEVDLARLRIARRTLVLGTVAADGVRIRLDGLPERRPRRERAAQVRVVVRHLDLHDLSFEGTDLPGKIKLTLGGLDAAWTTEDDVPRGHISVDRARLDARGIEPLEVSIRARINVTDGLQIPTLKIVGEGIRIEGSGRVSAVDGARLTAAGTVDLAQLDRTVRAHDKLRGVVEVSADLDSKRDDIVRLELASDRVEAAGFPLERLRGRLVVERDALRGSLDHALYHGGSLSASYDLAHLKGPTRPHGLRIHAEHVLLEGLLRDLGVPPARLAATFTTDAELAWNGRAIKRGQARGRGIATLTPLSTGTPVAGEVYCEINPDGLLYFSTEDLELGSSTVNWQGPLTFGSWVPAWSIHASPAALDEVVDLVNTWTGSQVLPEWVSGTGDIDVTLSGPWNQLAVGARLDAHPLLLPPIELDRVVAEATIRGSEMRLGPTRFSVGDSQGEVAGSIAWHPNVGTEQLDLDLRGHRLPVSRIARWLGVEGQADGSVSFTGGLRGPLAAPRGSWAVGIDDATLLGQPIGDGLASVDLADERFDARGMEFDGGLQGTTWWDMATGAVGGSLRWTEMPLTTLGDTAVRLAGHTADVSLDFLLPREDRLSGHFEAKSTTTRLTVHAEPDDIRIDGRLADSVTVTSQLGRAPDGSLQGNGTLNLESMERLLSTLIPNSQVPLSGDAAAVFSVEWPEGALPTITGQVQELDLLLTDRPVRLLSPAPFTVSDQGFAAEALHVAVMDDELFARWNVTPDGSLQGDLSGTMDGLLLRFLIPDWEPAGRASGEVTLLGTVDLPLFNGFAELSQGSFRLPGTRTILSGINGTVLLSSDTILLDGVDFRFMQGVGRCTGRLRHLDRTVDLGLAGTIANLRYEIFPGLVAHLSGSWQLAGPAASLDLSGDITVDRAALRRKDDVTTLLLDWFATTPTPPREGGPRLDIHVEADETIDINSPFVRLVGSASVDIGGTTSQPEIIGKVEFEEGGEVTLQTVRYELERGSLTFSDPSTNEPFIELQARTWVQNYEITVRITGTPDRLVPSVSSNPPLTEDEVYSLLGVGYRDPTLGRGAMGVGFASSMLTREITAELQRRAGMVLPVDQVRVDPFTESSTGNPTARVSVVNQLSPYWTFVLQSNLSAEREAVVVSRWYLAPGIFLEASRAIDGSLGVDLKLRRPY